MHHTNIPFILENQFSTEAAKIVGFLVNKDFSPNGEIAIASLFFYAQEHSKSVDEVLSACEPEWNGKWAMQHPDLRGNPDAPGAAGIQSQIALKNIYFALKIPNPDEEGRRISKGPIVVKTRNSSYYFGAADGQGIRTVVRDPGILPFQKCKITFLSEGKPMQLISYTDHWGEFVGTSVVQSKAPG